MWLILWNGTPSNQIWASLKKNNFIRCFDDNFKNLKNKMVNNIANLCEISKDQINIKGKTTEKLGVVGREKAIACEVICSVIKYD